MLKESELKESRKWKYRELKIDLKIEVKDIKTSMDKLIIGQSKDQKQE